MATSKLPTPQLQPVAEDKNLIEVVSTEGASCCGGGCCS